jgi:hypothetical protein
MVIQQPPDIKVGFGIDWIDCALQMGWQDAYPETFS